MRCKRCGGSDHREDGITRGRQRCFCRTCGRRFIAGDARPRHDARVRLAASAPPRGGWAAGDRAPAGRHERERDAPGARRGRADRAGGSARRPWRGRGDRHRRALALHPEKRKLGGRRLVSVCVDGSLPWKGVLRRQDPQPPWARVRRHRPKRACGDAQKTYRRPSPTPCRCTTSAAPGRSGASTAGQGTTSPATGAGRSAPPRRAKPALDRLFGPQFRAIQKQQCPSML